MCISFLIVVEKRFKNDLILFRSLFFVLLMYDMSMWICGNKYVCWTCGHMTLCQIFIYQISYFSFIFYFTICSFVCLFSKFISDLPVKNQTESIFLENKQYFPNISSKARRYLRTFKIKSLHPNKNCFNWNKNKSN